MLAARIGLAGAMERIDDDEPFVDVVLALSASIAGMIALLDLAAGRWPLMALPCLLILAAHMFRLSRLGIAAAIIVWLRLPGDTGIVTPLLMTAICAALLVGPGRVLDWLELRWEAGVDRRRRRREAALAARPEDEEHDAIGWIEDMPDSGRVM